MQNVENRPEAPWIKKSNNGVIFSDQLENCDELELSSKKSDDDKNDPQQVNG